MPRIVHKTCNLCEAMCGLRIHVDGRSVTRIEPDPDDPLSRGAICPKAIALKEIHEDPDRLRVPVRRTRSGFEPISWKEALAEAGEGLGRIAKRHGDDAVATYLGNPGAHNFGTVMTIAAFRKAIGSRNHFTASSLDQNPRHAVSILLYGNFLRITVPDIDRTDLFYVFGANPVVSNGSLMTAPGFKGRLARLRERGGRAVVFDPRRTETADLADEHVPVRPGHDAWLLAALVHTVLEEDLVRSSPALARCEGLSALRRALAKLSPEAVAERIGIPGEKIRSLARAFAGAERAVAYGRVGINQTGFGTLNSFLIEILNLVTGNLDRPGGAMFPTPAADLAQIAALRGFDPAFAQHHSRVRGFPSFNGELPTAVLAEEILTPGEGRIRGLVTIAGNPCLSAPNGAALDAAFRGLECHVAVDFYINESTRHAHVILPPTGSLEHDNHEILFHGFAVHNTAKYSPVVIEPRPEQRDDHWILLQLATAIAAEKAGSPLTALLFRLAHRLGRWPSTRTILDWMLRLGPYGDRFVPWRRGLRVADLERAPSGVDLGPLVPRLEQDVLSKDARMDLAPDLVRDELRRLREALGEADSTGGLRLIGRRDVRTNNSWLHNAPLAVRGRERCTVHMHPDDAASRRLAAGQVVRVRSRVGAIELPLELSDRLMPGVVSIPHGWGHRGAGLMMRNAEAHPGANCNVLVPDDELEPVVGNAIFNGVPVEVEPVLPRDSATSTMFGSE